MRGDKMNGENESKIKKINYKKNNTRKWAELQISNITSLERIKCLKIDFFIIFLAKMAHLLHSAPNVNKCP
mgnify:CR=1 FL=1